LSQQFIKGIITRNI